MNIKTIMNMNILNNFSISEKKNICYYIMGIMCYKFSLETMNACLSGIVLNRVKLNSGVMWADTQGVNIICQCIGTLLIGPFVKRFHAKSVLSISILSFAIIALTIPFLEYFSGGKIPAEQGSKNSLYWGSWNPLYIFVIFGGCGIFHGMIELMRRVIPADIVGGDIDKLKQLDASVHILYEIAGTTGAVLAYTWIGYFGWGYAFTILPIGFVLAFLSWYMITPRDEKVYEYEVYNDSIKNLTYYKYFSEICYSVFYSLYFGCKLLFTKRSLIWLIPTYTLPLVLHRYLENTFFAFYAKSQFKNSDYQTILVGGSNFGELLGALCVLLIGNRIKTPIPYLRLDAILLLFIWIFPYFSINSSDYLGSAWSLAPICSIISIGWAAGDVSLAAYIQSHLDKRNEKLYNKYTTPLGAIMSFLYILYLGLYYALNRLMAIVRDNSTDFKLLYILIGGVFFTTCSIIILISTFIPKGAFSINPELLDNTNTPRTPNLFIEDDNIEPLQL